MFGVRQGQGAEVAAREDAVPAARVQAVHLHKRSIVVMEEGSWEGEVRLAKLSMQQFKLVDDEIEWRAAAWIRRD